MNLQKPHEEASPSRAEIVAHMTSFLSKRLRIDAVSIDPSVKLVRYGLDSLEAVNLGERLERFLGHRISDSAVFDHPTLDALADYALELRKLASTRTAGTGHQAKQA